MNGMYKSNLIPLAIRVLLALAICFSLFGFVVPMAHAADVQYYETWFPVSIKYSDGWYGTFTHAPQTGLNILLFDDNNGRCIFTLPAASKPSGEQGGTKLNVITAEQAATILKSYPATASTPYPTEILSVLQFEDRYTGFWMGDKLKQKFLPIPELVTVKEVPVLDESGNVVLDEKDSVVTETKEIPIEITPEQQAVLDALELERLIRPNVDLSLPEYDPPRYAILPAATTSNWSSTGTWSAASGGATGASVPTNADEVYVDAASVAGANAILSVDAAASCLSLSFAGATNTPTLAGSSSITFYGNVTLIVGMNVTFTGNWYPAENSTFISAGKIISTNNLIMQYNKTFQLGDDLSVGRFSMTTGTFTTNNHNLTLTSGDGALNLNYANARTLNLGTSTLNIGDFQYDTGSNVTFAANTAAINIKTTRSLAAGNLDFNGANINLNGTAHTVSGSPTGIDVFTRNGTATKTDTITMTSGTTLTCTTFAMKGNSSTNRLLVQSSTLGTPAIITATNWTGSQNVDIIDITATNAVDLSAITGGSGDCQGNTNITFTTAAAQISNATGNWSTLATWQDGVGTDRVPLPQDDVSCSHTVTVDMPRIGKSITFTGIPTVTLSNTINVFGSLTVASGMTWTHSAKTLNMRGRGNYTLTSNGKDLNGLYIYNPTGTLSLSDGCIQTGREVRLAIGGLDLNDNDLTCGFFVTDYTTTRTLSLGSGTVTLTHNGDIVASKWQLNATNLTFNAETSTIVYTGSNASAQTFAGASQTYNNVTVQGAGAYTLTITGSNTFNVLDIDASVAAKTVKFTDGTTQTVAEITRDTGTNVITLDGTGVAGWNLTKVNPLIPNALTYIDCDYCTATDGAGVWYVGSVAHGSVDGGNNTNVEFTDPPLTCTTLAAIGVTMDKDGVTGGTFPVNISNCDGTPVTDMSVEYGLTIAYGATTAAVTQYTDGTSFINIPINLTPGATYHFRGVLENNNAGSPFNGADDTVVFTMPTVVTNAESDAMSDPYPQCQFNGTISDMGVATDAYVYFQYRKDGHTTDTTNDIILAPGTFDTILSRFNPQVDAYRAVVQIGAVANYGAWEPLSLMPNWYGIYTIAPTVIFILLLFSTGWFGRKAYKEHNTEHLVISISSLIIALIMMSLLTSVASAIFI